MRFFLALTITGLFASFCLANSTITISHQFTLIGNSKYPEGFKHFDYVNPEAPQGGTLKLATTLSFDSLNPFTNKGVAPPYIYDTHARLMIRSADEIYSFYGLVAERIEYPDDFSWVRFHLNPNAHFSDRSPITSADVAFTLNRLKSEGSLFYKNLYQHTSAETQGPQKVLFRFEKPSPKAIAWAAFMPVLSKRFWNDRLLSDPLTEAPVSSGPMKPTRFIKGQSITYEKIKEHWTEQLPTHIGRHNVDRVRFDVYRDEQAAAEAFKAGLYDLRYEHDLNQWFQAYNTPAVKSGRIKRETVTLEFLPGTGGLVFNTRLDKFRDIRVRQALSLLFDFEWINQKLLHSAYQRTTSFFSHTALQAEGLPDKEELNLLLPYKDQLQNTVFEPPNRTAPVTDGSGNNRANQRHCPMDLLKESGWVLQKGTMTNLNTGKPLKLTILSDTPSQERLLVPYRKSLAKVGIALHIQTVDKSLFRKRMRAFDFEVSNWYFWRSLFPGQELRNCFSSQAAQEPGTGNIAGIQHPVIDHLLDRLLSRKNYEELKPVARALDRVLLSEHYLIPKWHTRQIHLLYWDNIQRPPQQSLYWLPHNTWWSAKPR